MSFSKFGQFKIRKIVGTLIAVAEGKITKRDVYEMLTIPSKHAWDASIQIAPPYGLYLARIEYDEDAKKMPEECDDVRESGINWISL